MAALVLGLVGLVLNIGTAVWVLLSADPENPRYTEIRALYDETDPVGLRRLVRDQRKAAAVVLVGTACQAAGVVFGFAA